eukprot:COSAG05_NODE_3162_length_2276_cov_2.407158_3_plen_288_part_00
MLAQNFYVQLHGRKRFFLMPPGAAIHLYTYPRLHPSYRQIQTDLNASPKESALKQNYPRLHALLRSVSTDQSVTGTKLDAMEVTLAPGEVLYIPPYWFHMATVTGTEPAIGVNVWSEAQELSLTEESEQVALPFEDSWSTRQRKSAVAAYAREFLRAVSGDDRTSLALMVETRWAPLLLSTDVGAPLDGECDEGTDTCIADQNLPGFTCSIAGLQLDSVQEQRFGDLVRQAAEPLKRAITADAKYGTFIATMLAWNRIEQTALWAVAGQAGRVGSFVRQLPHACEQG